MSDPDGIRDPRTGRFRPNKSGNPRGRPKRAQTADEAILRAVSQPVVVTEGGRRHRRTKLEIAAAQIVNQGASGNLSAGKATFDLVRRAEERKSQVSTSGGELPPSDREIADRFVAKIRRMIEEEQDNEFPTDTN